MRTFRIFIYLLLGILLSDCDSQPIPSNLPDTISDIRSRGIIKDTSLPVGKEALFNISGDITLTDEVVTFDGTSWGIKEELTISDYPSESLLTALYPAYNDEHNLITENPYSENTLEDILIAQQTLTDQTNIELEFSHLFTLLTINVGTSINTSLTQIAVEAPKVISMNGKEGTFATSNTLTHTTTLSKNTTGEYSFVIPSIDNCPLTLSFNFGEEQTSHTLTHDFKSGFKYECNVVDKDTRPGIRTVNELIAFSYLINGKEPPKDYQAYTLNNFGETVNERIVYRLLADIDLSQAEEQSLLLPIGYYETKAFQHIFDGEGHTIFNLIIPDKSINDNIYKDVSGLFGCIGINGIVKNLHINGAKTTATPSCSRTGGIAAQNHGLIDNCSVQNTTFRYFAKVGGICGSLSSTGYLTNCYTINNTFYLKSGYISGGMTGDANGRILNCYSYSNNFKNTVSGSYSGGIAGQSTSGRIYNCYIYQNSIPDNWGALTGINSNAKILNILFNACRYLTYSPKKNNLDNAQTYNTNFNVNGTHISSLLNNWISTTGKEFYPDFTFRTWTSIDNNSPAIFQQ